MTKVRSVSVSCEHNLDLFTFMTDNGRTLFPNMEMILKANALS